MKVTLLKKVLSFILCIVLVAAIALFTIGCNGNENTNSEQTGSSQTASNSETDKVTELGKGQTSFYFDVVDADGKETAYKIFTDKKTVGEALIELELISGDEGAYGLYVKTVDGITLDYDKDGKYWAFYENGAYAAKGVDLTDITAGAKYAFKAE